MKKTKFLTCLAALTLLLAGCETAAENLDSDTTGTESGDTTTSDTGTTEGGDTGTGEGGSDGSGESRLGLLGQAFELVGGANYTLTCYSTAVNTDDHMSYSGVVTEVGAISTSYTGSTTGMINDPDDGGFVDVTLDGNVLKASAAPDPTRSVQDYYISSDIDTALFEELEDGRFALKDEGFTSDVLQDLFPDKPFTGGLITPSQGTIFIEVEDDLSKVTYYYDSNLNGTFTVTLVVTNLGTTVFPYDLSTQYVGVGSEEVTTWAGYLTSTTKASADELLGADLDDVLPFYVVDGGYSYTGVMSGKFDLQWSGNLSDTDWVNELFTFGYSEVTANEEYVLEGAEVNYTVTFISFFGTTDLYLAPTEKPSAQEEPTTWSEYLAQNAGNNIDGEADINALLGAAIDEILPYVVPECGYNFITVDATTGCVSFTLDNATYAASTLAEWESALIAFGYTDLGNLTYQNEAGYKVTLTDWTFIDTIYIYVYPPVDTGDEGDEDLKTAQSILDVVTQTSYLDWDAFHGESVDDWEETISEYLTTDEDGNAYGYVVSSEDSNTYYYYGGYKCVYNQNGVAQTPGVSYLDYENELDDYSSPLLSAHSLNLSNVDSYEINELGDGYELVITNGASSNVYGYGTEYVYTVDSEFNLIALGQYGPENVASSDLVGSYAEKITYADVEEALAATSFNPADFGLGKTSAADQITAVVSKLTEIGSDFDYDSGFYYDNMELRPGDNLSAYYYDALTITATTDNRGYMSQSSMDILDLENTYYSYEYFSDGTDTYYYDADDGQSKEDGLFEFDTYQAMAEMYFSYMDFDQVCELIEASASVSDIEVDEDYEVSDDTIYIYANNEDYTLYYELDVEYDEDGLTYFSFSYMDDLYAYAVTLIPTQYVDDPEWYVPTTGSSAIADLFNAALDEKNYTIVLEITDYQSNETAYDPNAFSPYVQLEPLQDLWCKITYTTDAAVVEYYGSYDELLEGTVMDVEYYLNTDSGLDVFMVFDWYDVDTVYYQWTEEGLTWQDYLGSLFGLEDYFSNFVEGETTTTERGSEVSYTLDNLDSDFLEALIDALVDNGNYWAWETHGVEQILSEGADVSYTVTYLEDSGVIEFVFDTGEYTYYDADKFCYYLEQTTIKVYVLDAGSSSTPDYTLEYNW